MHAGMGLVLSLAMVLGGAVLFWWGVRGRRIDDHPICRACGFDLFGLPEESHRCSECGVDLQERGTIRIGHRRPFRVVMVLGMLVLLAGGSGLGLVWKSASGQFDANRYKPVWWLLSDANHSSPSTRDAALAELLNRLKNKSLSKGQVQRIAEKALEVQGDKNKLWATGWGDFVELAQQAGALSVEQWQLYLKQALMAYQLEARPKVRRGAALPLRIKNDLARVGTTMRIYTREQWQQIQISGILSDRTPGGDAGSRLSATEWGSSSWTVPLDSPAFAKLEIGAQTARVAVAIKVFCDPAAGSVSMRGTPDYQGELDLEAKWELVAEPTVKAITDESVRPAVEKAMEKVRVEQRSWWPSSGADYVGLVVSCKNLPVGLAFDVIARQGEKEWKLGSGTFRASAGQGLHTGSTLPGLKGNKVDVILRPSLEAAEGDVDCNEFWNGQIVLPDVQLPDASPPATQAAQ